jgi:hypothetical protein
VRPRIFGSIHAPKTIVMGYPRVETECLLVLAEHARGGAAVEGVNVQEGWDATSFNSQTHKFREYKSIHSSYIIPGFTMIPGE